jgi:hypothetical protein
MFHRCLGLIAFDDTKFAVGRVVKKKSPKITSAAFSVSIRGQAGKNS